MNNLFFKPESVLKQINLSEGTKVADFGAGTGYITTLLAKAVGPEGKVFAIDIQKIVLEAIKSRAKMMNLFNIETIWGNLEVIGGSNLENNSVDFVFLINVVFQTENKENIFKEAYRVLKNGGFVVFVDWKPEAPENNFGPLINQRVSKSQIVNIASNIGFQLSKELNAGQYHYGLLFKK